MRSCESSSTQQGIRLSSASKIGQVSSLDVSFVRLDYCSQMLVYSSLLIQKLWAHREMMLLSFHTVGRYEGVSGCCSSSHETWVSGRELNIDFTSMIVVYSLSKVNFDLAMIFHSSLFVDWIILSNALPHHEALSTLNFQDVPQSGKWSCTSTCEIIPTIRGAARVEKARRQRKRACAVCKFWHLINYS